MTYVEPHMTEALKDHVLIEVPYAEGGVRAFWLRKPGTGMYSLLVSFLPSGHIALSGDLTIGGRHGCVSATGYGFDWWVSKLDEDYLCGKFLEKKWQPEIAKRDVRQHLETALKDHEPKQADRWQAVLDELEAGDIAYEGLVRAMEEEGFTDAWDYSIGEDYDASGGWLVAAHRKFRELWLAREAVKA